MTKSRQVFLAAIVILVPALLSGCHGGGSGTESVKWVKQGDSSQVLELRLPVRSVLGKVHQVVFGQRLKGSYVLKNGTEKSEGRVTQDNGDFTLTSDDGKTQRFQRYQQSSSVEGPSALKDEYGGIWNREDAPALAKRALHKW